MTTFVTGGLGFIGSNFVISHLKKYPEDEIIIIDNNSYAANESNLEGYWNDWRLKLKRCDIRNFGHLESLYHDHEPHITFHFAAESHVDNSIRGDDIFLDTNINGTHNILKCIRKYGGKLVHVSTDEVYGSLGHDDPGFTESTPYDPRNPYSASKAASDHLVRAYVNTHGLDAVVTNCSNNYGPRQHSEKFIPTVIRHIKNNTPIIGGGVEMSNLDMVTLILDLMGKPVHMYQNWINFVPDRKGHDFRYAMDATKIAYDLSWQAKTNINEGLIKTLEYYNA